MKHFGIWNVETSGWIMSADGVLFWTTSRVVAEKQLALFNRYSIKDSRPLEIREFIDKTEELKQQ